MKPLLRALHRPVYESRLRELSRLIVPLLEPGDRVLDVGCGSGALGERLLHDGPAELTVHGMETRVRDGALIPVEAYSGSRLPRESATEDVVILADVLHHEPEPEHLLREACRVARRLVLVKDHVVENRWDQWRVALIDWAANAGYDVPCLFRYPSAQGWHELFKKLEIPCQLWTQDFPLYPAGYQLVFGGNLHCFAVLNGRIDEGSSSS